MLCLVIGYGSAGRRHTQILQSLKTVRGVHIVSQQTVAGIKTYQSITDALAENSYGYIVIASTTARHDKDLQILFKAKVRPKILIEKPIFHRYKRTNRPAPNIFVGYNLRFHPAIARLREILKKSGETYYASLFVGQYLPDWRPGRNSATGYSASKKDGGGVLLDLSHEIDLLHSLFGEIRKLAGLRTKRSSLNIDTEDIAIMSGITKNNVIFSINMDYLSFIPMRNIIVQTQSNTIHIDLIRNILQITTKDGLAKIHKPQKSTADQTCKMMHRAIIESHTENVCTMLEGLRINYWIDRLKQKSILRTVTQ